MQFGVQLGCNGIVQILSEPIDTLKANNPLALLEKCLQQRRHAVIGTLFSFQNFAGVQPGTCFFSDEKEIISTVPDQLLADALNKDAAAALAGKTSLFKEYGNNKISAFIEVLEPLVSLVIIGAGNDALPLSHMAGLLGWQTTIIDGRSTHANPQRFSRAHQILVGKPADAIALLHLDERTVVVLMTHNYNYDREILGLLMQKDCRYIGTLGPKKRLERMLTELQENGLTITEKQKAKIYGPTGLDTGAETAEEIAISVLAEIMAVLTHRRGGFLRDRMEGIHSRLATEKVETQTTS